MQQTGELEEQFNQLLQQQQQMLAMQQQEQVTSSRIHGWLKNPLNLALLAILPALLVIFALYFFVFRRKPEVEQEDVPASKKVEELNDEEASKALDRELMAGGQDNADDGLFNLDGDASADDDDELGDDLSALEAELTQTGQLGDDDDDFSIRLDDEDDEDESAQNQDKDSAQSADDDELADEDADLLPTDDDDVGQADTDDDEGSSELSQEELDLFWSRMTMNRRSICHWMMMTMTRRQSPMMKRKRRLTRKLSKRLSWNRNQNQRQSRNQKKSPSLNQNKHPSRSQVRI